MAEITYSKPLTLDEPIVRGETKIESLRLRKPDTGALRGTKLGLLGQMDVDQVRMVIPRISEPMITAAEFDALDPADTMQIADALFDFLLTKAQRALLPTT